MLQVRNLNFNYGKYDVLKNISFSIPKGCLCGLFGPNGCGKTTLFKCCLGFLPFSEGMVRVVGENTQNLKLAQMAKRIAYVPQEHRPSFPYQVKEIVLMGRTPHFRGVFRIRKQDRQKAFEALEILGILKLADRPYNQLSGGQRQMVLIARAIAQETPLIFLDEPTAALDFSNQIRIWQIMRHIAENGVTVIACTHDPNHVSWFCHQTIIMNNKGLIADGPPDVVMKESVLHQIYQDICAVRNIGTTKMILPKELADTGLESMEFETGREKANDTLYSGEMK